MFTRTGPYANFNHHEGVDRQTMKSTCSQIFLGIKKGLFDIFMKKGRLDNLLFRAGQPYANVYVNHPDQDVCLAVWLLRNPEAIIKKTGNAEIEKLVNLEDLLDTTTGAYPLDFNSPLVKQM